MSLLPIIYTSLLLTGILFLTVLTISYISFKVKNKRSENILKIKNQTPSNRIVAQHQHEISNQKNFSTNYNQLIQSKTISVKKVSAEKKDGSGKSNPKIHNAANLKYFQKRERRINRRFMKNSSDNKLDYLKKSSMGKLKGRIEVMNPGQIQNNNSNKIHITKNPNKEANQLSNKNLLTHYHDDDRIEFFTLKSAGFTHS
ncbi:MAG: hypothetical protein A2V66_00170 [Ignavibacteria bacterium RBG_13_36_8]|nr:MAG: hypothetical protein A2V66_00170 [Ignavibacteria bacterium RBG_13_36_8]